MLEPASARALSISAFVPNGILYGQPNLARYSLDVMNSLIMS